MRTREGIIEPLNFGIILFSNCYNLFEIRGDVAEASVTFLWYIFWVLGKFEINIGSKPSLDRPI